MNLTSQGNSRKSIDLNITSETHAPRWRPLRQTANNHHPPPPPTSLLWLRDNLQLQLQLQLSPPNASVNEQRSQGLRGTFYEERRLSHPDGEGAGLWRLSFRPPRCWRRVQPLTIVENLLPLRRSTVPSRAWSNFSPGPEEAPGMASIQCLASHRAKRLRGPG